MKLIKHNTFFNDPWTELDRFFGSALADTGRMLRGVPVRAYNTTDERIIELDLPGVQKEDIALEFEKGILDVSAKRKSRHGDKEGEVAYEESIRVGTDVDFQKAKAELDSGILTITLPKREHEKPFQINVK